MYRWLEIQQQHFEIEDTQKAALGLDLSTVKGGGKLK
jgi:hypothetical protein